MATELFRITLRKRYGASYPTRMSKIYESKSEFLHALLNAQSEIWSYEQPRGTFTQWIERAFRVKRGQEDLARSTHVSDVVSVEKFVGDDWVKVDWSFEPARLILDGVTYSDD
jgi:hypothetical protein